MDDNGGPRGLRCSGTPPFIFWGIIAVYVVFIVALELLLRYVYTDMPLDASAPSTDRKPLP